MNDTNRIILAGTESTCLKASSLTFDSGEELIPLPLLSTEALTQIKFPKQNYDWVIFTSPAAVKHFSECDEAPAFEKIATVGPATSREAKRYNLKSDFTPTVFNSEGMSSELPKMLTPEQMILFPCSVLADNHLESSLKNQGFKVDRVDLYKPIEILHEELPNFDSIAFFSSSSVKAFKKSFPKETLKDKKIAAIGKKAAKTVNELYGLEVSVPNESTAMNTVQILL